MKLRREKKLVWMLSLCLVGLFIVSACGGNGNENASTAPSGDLTIEEQIREFYEGETINLMIPIAAGGGYDDWGRMLVPYIEKHTGATVVVTNTDGAGSLRGHNVLYGAPNDGMAFGLVNGGGLISAVLADDAGVQYELAEFSWLGRLTGDHRVLAVLADNDLTLDDILAGEPVRIGATGLGGGSYLDPVILREALDLNMDVIPGFDGSGGIEQALLRGDVEGMFGSWGSRISAVEDGSQKILLQSGLNRHKDLPDVPTWMELVEGDEHGTAILNVQEGMYSLGRGVAAPPDVDEDVLELMRAMFDIVVNDPDLIAEGIERDNVLDPMTGSEVEAVLEEIREIPEDVRDLFTRAMDGEL